MRMHTADEWEKGGSRVGKKEEEMMGDLERTDKNEMRMRGQGRA